MNSSGSNRRQSYRAKQLRALLIVLSILGVCLAGLAGILYWAHQDLESAAAERIRSFIGIPPARPAMVEAEPMVEPEPAPVDPPVESQAAPPPEPEPEPEPEPVHLAWEDFLQRTDLWPRNLHVTFKQSVPIQYNGSNFGHIYFTPGQQLEVDALKEGMLIHGSINGNHLIIPANCTNLDEWFAQTHGEDFVLNFPLNTSPPTQVGPSTLPARSMLQVREELRQWCITNYGSSQIEIEADSLVFKWLPESDIPVLYRYEAREIARRYLLLQAEHGGADNYAACRILDPGTGDLLGADSIFIPTLSLN